MFLKVPFWRHHFIVSKTLFWNVTKCTLLIFWSTSRGKRRNIVNWLLSCTGHWKTYSLKGFGCTAARDSWLPWSCYWWEVPIKSRDTLPFTGTFFHIYECVCAHARACTFVPVFYLYTLRLICVFLVCVQIAGCV